MKLLRSTVLALTLLITLTIPTLAQNNRSVPPDETRSYLVIMNDAVVGDSGVLDVAEVSGGRVRYAYTSAFNGATVEMTPEQATQLQADPRVKSIIEEIPVHALSQTTPTGVQRIDTPGIDGSGPDVSSDINIAVLDTGIDLDHPDLNVGTGINCVDPGIPPDDDHGHGTHVAGTIAAHDNSIGVVGVAPGAVVHPVKVLNSNGRSVSGSLGCGLDWVLENSSWIDVVNMSLGGYTSRADEDNCGLSNGDGFHQFICAIVDAGVTVVVAAGNSDAPTTHYVPARYREAITVSALADSDGQPGGNGSSTTYGADDSMASFSNYGDHVDVIAPGVSILSTYPGGYATMSGTSMAAPHVAGAAAAYIDQNGGASPASIDSALKSTGGFDWTGDKDGSKEPLVNIAALLGGGSPEFHDVGVTSVSAPDTAVQGEAITISATLQNNGTLSEQITVNISGSPSGFSDSTTISLNAGASTTVDFIWPTDTSTSTGSHSFTVSASVPNDSDSSNDSAAASIEVQAATGGGNDALMYVSDVTLTGTTIMTSSGPYHRLSGSVSVVADGEPVSGADVQLFLQGPSSSITVIRTTNSSGVASIIVYGKSDGVYSMTVTSVSRDGLTYDSSLNVESSASITMGDGAPPPEETHDAAVTGISAPDTVMQGDDATISAVVKNNGNVSDVISVSISGSPSGFTQATSVSLAAGASTTVQFTWPTDDATALGNHDFTVTASVSGDSNLGNNARSTSINVEENSDGGGDETATLYVSAVTLSAQTTRTRSGTSHALTGQVVVAVDGQPVSGAAVETTLTGPGLNLTFNGMTDSNGAITINYVVSNSGAYTLSVTDVSKDGFDYDPAQNVVSQASVSVS